MARHQLVAYLYERYIKLFIVEARNNSSMVRSLGEH